MGIVLSYYPSAICNSPAFSHLRNKMALQCSSYLLMACLFLFASDIMTVTKGEEDPVTDVSPPSSCLNCTFCGVYCFSNIPPPPPPPPDYGSYTQPPPPPPPSPSPPPPSWSETNCPPAVVPCCDNTPPTPPGPSTYLPYYNYSASPTLCSGRSVGSISSGIFFLLFLYGGNF